MIVGPSFGGDLRHSEVLDFAEFIAEGFDYIGNLAAGGVKGGAWVGVQRGIDGESEEPVWLCGVNASCETCDFHVGAVSAGPPLATKGDPNGALVGVGVGFEGLSGGTCTDEKSAVHYGG